MSNAKSPLRDRLLSNSPDPIKSSIIRDSGMGWISPTSNPGSQSSASSGSITSPLRIAKRDSPRSLPQPPLARRSSSSYRHVRNNNLVSKSPFKSQILTPSSTPSRNVPFPSPRRVSGEKRPRPSSMHEQAENENERPFSFKRERRQSKGFQGLIEKEPVTKSPFKQPTQSTEEQPAPPPLPLTYLLPQVPTSSSEPSLPTTSLAPTRPAISSTGVSPARSSLVSRRMHGPRLSSGSRSKRERRKTVTWDERCDVVEFHPEEDETDEEGFNSAEEDDGEMQVEDENQPDEDPFFHGDQPTAGKNASARGEDSSYESIELSDVSGDNGPSVLGMALDPDASISGLVEEIFATSGATTTTAAAPSSNAYGANVQGADYAPATSTPPHRADDRGLPPDLETEDGVPLGRSHHAARFLQHQRERAQSPKHSPQQPPHFSPHHSAHSSPQQLLNGYTFNLPTHASPQGPPATPLRRSAAPSPSTHGSRPLNTIVERSSASSSRAASPSQPSAGPALEVGPGHLSTPPLGRSTHAERQQKAKEEECDDVLMLPATPSPCKSARKPNHADGIPSEGLVPKFEVDIRSSNNISAPREDPFALPPLKDEGPPVWEDGPTMESIEPSSVSADTSQVAENLQLDHDAMKGVQDFSRSTANNSYSGDDEQWQDFNQSHACEGQSCIEERASSPGTRPASPGFEAGNSGQKLDRSNSLRRQRISRYEVQRRLLDRRSQTFSHSSRSSSPNLEADHARREASHSTDDVRADKDTMSVLTTMTDMSTETAVIAHAERRTLTGANVAAAKDFGLLNAGERLQFDFGSKFGRGLDLGDVKYGARNASLDGFGAMGPTGKEKTPSIQSGGSMKMGDVDVDMDMKSALDRLMDDVAGAKADESIVTEDGDSFELLKPPTSSSGPRLMATDTALLHNNGFVSRNVSEASSSSAPPPVPPKDNIRSREQLILEKRREARRIEEDESQEYDAPPQTGARSRASQALLGVGRPSRRRSMSTGDAELLGGGAKKRGDIMLDIAGVGGEDEQDDRFGDSIEKELNKLVDPPAPDRKTKYLVREREGTIYASSSDLDVISHMAGPGDVDAGKAWRAVRRPSDMNEYSKQIKEYRAQEKSGKAYGKVFVKVLGVKGIHIPLPQQPTALTCTLNNGIHFVSTPECQLGRDFRIEQEFELIEHNKLEFTLTLKIRRDPHIIGQFKTLAPPPPQAPAPPPVVQTSSKGGMRSFFSSSPKKSSKEKLPAQPAPPPQPAQRLPENLARYLKPDGTLARAFVSFKDVASRCDTRLFETSYPLIGQRVELGGKFSTLQVGEIVLQMFRLPPLPGIAPSQLPQSLEECHRGLRHINWHKITYFEGTLTQCGGDCSTWRRRQLRVIGGNLVAFNDVTKKATATINLKKAIAVEDLQEVRQNALGPDSRMRSSRYDEYEGLYGVERSFCLVFPQDQEILFFADTDEEKARWLDVLRALIGHIPPHPFWAELLWQRQEELTRAAQSSPRPPAQSTPSWLVPRGAEGFDLKKHLAPDADGCRRRGYLDVRLTFADHMVASPRAPLPSIHHTLSSRLPTATERAIGREVVQCSSVAALAFLLWDIFITVDDEVKFIWPKPWTLTKFLYFYVRYVPLMVQISILFVGTDLSAVLHFTPHDCYIWQVYQGIATLSIVGTVDVILILRVVALYHGCPTMRVVLAFLYVLELVGMSVGIGLAVPRIKYDEICLVTHVPTTFVVYGGAAVSFQIILFVLTVCKFLEAVRSGWGDVPLILLLMRDGTWAFMLLMAIYIGQASLYGLENHALSGILFGWLLTAFSFSGYRILLNLNHLSPPDDVQRTGTDIQFTTQILSEITENLSDSFELLALSSVTTTTRIQQSSGSSRHNE
ncbi:putative pleckstrin homology domain [Lyophyllum shimeji]|uniref:Pleckstrin homology domain n=1 Tax=Lyophyllum shimeji TaxID=47721 RepID=A0A9P3PL23_LYOSH|nr:putative pleckstrin homology domain [Lyophyllum shimeji]